MLLYEPMLTFKDIAKKSSLLALFVILNFLLYEDRYHLSVGFLAGFGISITGLYFTAVTIKHLTMMLSSAVISNISIFVVNLVKYIFTAVCLYILADEDLNLFIGAAVGSVLVYIEIVINNILVYIKSLFSTD